ncbi:hypothetical protein WN943_025163 [Citrus x changshan-huyou]
MATAETQTMVVGIDDSEHGTYALQWTLVHFFANSTVNPPFKLVIVHAKPSPSSVIAASQVEMANELCRSGPHKERLMRARVHDTFSSRRAFKAYMPKILNLALPTCVPYCAACFTETCSSSCRAVQTCVVPVPMLCHVSFGPFAIANHK